MNEQSIQQLLDHACTTWHITFGTYGARLLGGSRPTVDRQHNKLGEAFVPTDPDREQLMQERMRFAPRYFTHEQRRHAEAEIPLVCERGGWGYRICAVAVDHIHVLCDILPSIHGEQVRRLIKRWLGQSLSRLWPLRPKESWWAEEGSNVAIHDDQYLNNAYLYILRQRATPEP